MTPRDQQRHTDLLQVSPLPDPFCVNPGYHYGGRELFFNSDTGDQRGRRCLTVILFHYKQHCHPVYLPEVEDPAIYHQNPENCATDLAFFPDKLSAANTRQLVPGLPLPERDPVRYLCWIYLLLQAFRRLEYACAKST